MHINWNEINRQSHMLVEQRRQEAEMYRLAQIAAGQVEKSDERDKQIGIVRVLHGLVARLRVVRLGAS